MEGYRAALLIVDIQEASQIPAIAEPLYLGLGARVTFHPAMTPEDLMQAGPSLENAARNFS